MTRVEVSEWLCSLVGQLAEEFAGVAELDRGEVDGILVYTLEPNASGAAALRFSDFAPHTILLEAGVLAERFESDDTFDELEHLEQIARSIIAGRMVTVTGLGRSRTAVTFDDGTTETGFTFDVRGLLPSPGWMRRGPTMRYAPWR